MKKFAIAIAAALMLGTCQADAAVIKFDDLSNDGQSHPNGAYDFVPTNYAGYVWENFEVVSENNHNRAKATSPENVAYNGGDGGGWPSAMSSDSGYFDFNSAYFATFYPENGFTLEIASYRDGAQVAFENLFLDKSHYKNPTQFNFGGPEFSGINKLTFTPLTDGEPAWFTMDNMDVSQSAPVPEPTSITLGLMGAAGLIGLRRKK